MLATLTSESDIRCIHPFGCACYLKLDRLSFCERLVVYPLQVIAVEEEVLSFLCRDEAVATVRNQPPDSTLSHT